MKDFKLTKEFFGGILHSNLNYKNLFIDDFLYSFLETLENNGDLDEFFKMHEEDENISTFIELFQDLLEYGLLKINYDIVKSEIAYKDHLSSPFRIFYDITYECNLRCKHCFTNSGKKNELELTTEEKINLVNQFKELGVDRISIAGGEPFIAKDLFVFIEECKENNIEVSISTNGTLFTKEKIELLNKYNIKTLTVSVDGGDEQSGDFIRGAGSFEKTLKGLELLKNFYKNNYCIKVTLMKSNIKQIEDIINLAIFYQCKSIKFNCVREDGRARNNSKDIILSDSEYVSVVKEIEELKCKYSDKIQIKAPLNVFCEEDYEHISELGFGCFAGKESMCIDPLGNVKPCSHFPKEYICGNIRETKLVKIWHQSEVLYKFRHLEGNIECRECSEYNKCRGGCRYRALCAGDINQVDPYCYLGNKIID